MRVAVVIKLQEFTLLLPTLLPLVSQQCNAGEVTIIWSDRTQMEEFLESWCMYVIGRLSVKVPGC